MPYIDLEKNSINQEISVSEIQKENLQTIQSVVNEVRNTVNHYGSTVKDLFFNPKRRNPFSKDHVEFVSDQRYFTDPTLLSSIYSTHSNENEEKLLTPTINFDVNLNRPLLEVGQANISGIEHKIKQFQMDLFNDYEMAKKESRFDNISQKVYSSAYQEAEQNLNWIKNNVPQFKNSDTRDLLIFITGHELAHLSFKERNNPRFDYMDELKGKFSESEIQSLSSAFYSINRNTTNALKQQHNGANYLSTRDEIHSDLSGLFLLSLIQIKNNNFDEQKFKSFAKDLGKMREINNLSADLNGMSTHNSGKAFNDENLDFLISLAQKVADNPNQSVNVVYPILYKTENLFLETLKDKGLILKDTIYSNLFISQEAVDILKKTDPDMEIRKIYANQVSSTNKVAEESYESCVKSVHKSYQNNCSSILNGNQLKFVDKNNDKIMDFKTVSQAIKNIGGYSALNQQIQHEADSIVKLVNIADIAVKVESNINDDTIDIKNQKLNFSF